MLSRSDMIDIEDDMMPVVVVPSFAMGLTRVCMLNDVSIVKRRVASGVTQRAPSHGTLAPSLSRARIGTALYL